MPLLPGEERLATVYTDIHYYFTQPVIRPQLHRFDKASYFYIYYNSTRHTSRLEVANNAGTPEQDAFNGYLDRCRVINSYKFPTLVTLVVDPPESASPASQEWLLHPNDQGKNPHRLHTLDIYFWAQEDAKMVTDLFKRLLHPSQLDIVDVQGESQEEAAGGYQQQQHASLSPVVQKLENVAISDPAYRNGQTRNSQNQPQAPTAAVTLPPPPPLQTASSSTPSQTSRTELNAKQDQPANFTPMAYNPAAPAAPEPIAHREDTPPPVDADDGTGLAAAAMRDHGYIPGAPQSPPYTGAPSGSVPNIYGGHYASPPSSSNAPTYGSPPTHSHQPYQQYQSASVPGAPSSFSPPPPNPSTNTLTSTIGRRPSIAQQTYAPPPPDPMAQMYAQENTAAQTPGTQFYNNLGQTHQSLSHVQPHYADYLAARPQAPPGGYSQFSYDPAQQQRLGSVGGGGSNNSYDVHNQVYRPTEDEARHSHGGHRPSTSSSGGGKSRFDQGADRLENRLGKLFKKVEKRIG